MIGRILEEDETRHRKQRHAAKRILKRLRDEHSLASGYTIVKDYARERRLQLRDMIVRLVLPPGHAQTDFGDAIAEIGGIERKGHFLAVDPPESDACHIKAFPAETTEAFCDGRNAAFGFFAGVP